jgi:HSP20 family protein
MPEIKEPKETAPKEKKNGQPVVANGPQAEPTGAAVRTTPAPPQYWMGGAFPLMHKFAEEMDHLFAEMGMGTGWRIPSVLSRGRELFRRETGLVPAEWSPQVDIFETNGQIMVRVDLPGLSKEDVKVEVADDVLRIHGERRTEKKEERTGYYLNERSFGSFYRSIPLPEGVDTNKASASFRNGVLEVTMPAPRRKEARAHRIEVKE